VTEEEATALGKRLVACRHFRPMRGMLDMQGRTWDTSLLWRWSNDVDVPDLRDPATLGCVLAMVREAWSDEYACVLPVDYGPGGIMWVCRLTATGWPLTRSVWSIEAKALVAALEAAP
jgi:hypothetical protein